MAGEDPRVEVNTLADKKGQPDRRRKPKQQNRADSSGKSQKCTRCGHNSHRPQEKCPAKHNSCRRCNKVGHFASVCRRPTGRVNTIDEDYSSDNEEGLDQDMHLLHMTYLEVNGVNDKSAPVNSKN